MFAMSGGTLAHSQIPLSVAVVLKRQLDGKGCRVSNSDLRIQISPSGPFVYPMLQSIAANLSSPTSIRRGLSSYRPADTWGVISISPGDTRRAMSL